MTLIFKKLMVLLQSDPKKLQNGDKAPNFNLKGIDGEMHSLESFKGKALLIVFMCNHCPFVKAKTEVLRELDESYKDKGLVVVGINSNDAENYPDDSFEKMKEFASEKSFKFAYLVDETQEIAKTYGAVCTPDPFLFDAEQKLAYHGRFNDALTLEAEPTTHDMADAIEALLEGKPVDKPFLPSQGCSIKWK